MRRLATELAGASTEFDFSVASLGALESHVRAGPRDAAAIAAASAYLGETVRRQCGAKVVWSGSAADDTAGLTNGSMTVYPGNKVVKFLTNGAVDSPAAFAPVAVSLLRGSGEDVQPATKRREIPAATVAAFDAFFATPSLANFRQFDAEVGGLHDSSRRSLLAKPAALAGALYPLLSEVAVGRGYNRFDAGNVAARWIFRMFEANAAERAGITAVLEARITDSNKYVRQNAARALARVYLSEAASDKFAALYRSADSAVGIGLVAGLSTHVYYKRHYRLDYTLLDAHAEVLRAALLDTKQRNDALDTVRCMATHLKTSIDPLFAPVFEILDSGAPQQVETMLLALMSHVYSIKHGNATWTDGCRASVARVVRHSKPLPGKNKVTKVQRAAWRVFRAFESLGDTLPADLRTQIAAARA